MLTYIQGLTQPAAVMAWLYTWHHTSSSVIAKLLMNKPGGRQQASNLLTRMSRQGWIRAIETEELQGQNVYMLTPDGLEEVLSSGLVAGVNYDLAISAVHRYTLRHDIGVQYIVAHLCSTLDVSHIETDRSMRGRMPPGAKVPDAVITVGQARIAIEFEREAKASERLDRFLLSVYDDLKARRYENYLMFSRIPSVMQHYAEAADKPITRWRKNPTTKRWEEAGKVQIESETLARMKFRFMPEIGAAISPMSYRKIGEKKHA